MGSHIVGQSSDSHTPTVEVRITPTIERAFKRREAFPALRTENARRIVNGATGVYDITVEDAEAILLDAEQQCKQGGLPKGLPAAYGYLIRSLKPAIKHAKGLWDDPGFDVVKTRLEHGLARFHVGDAVRFFSRWVNDPDDGERLFITRGYDLYQVVEKDGGFVGRDGTRRSYRWGYIARRPEGEECFFPPHELQRMDYERGYLRLVETQPARAHG